MTTPVSEKERTLQLRRAAFWGSTRNSRLFIGPLENGLRYAKLRNFSSLLLKKKKAHKSHTLTKGGIFNADRLLATTMEHSVVQVEHRLVVSSLCLIWDWLYTHKLPWEGVSTVQRMQKRDPCVLSLWLKSELLIYCACKHAQAISETLSYPWGWYPHWNHREGSWTQNVASSYRCKLWHLFWRVT